MTLPDKIPGIYNYCDRWCERCPFTLKCAIFEEKTPSDDDDDILNDVSNNLASAIYLLNRIATEMGCNLDAPEEESWKKSREYKEAMIRKEQQHPLFSLSKQYAFSVRKWFSELTITEYADTIHQTLELELRSDDSVQKEVDTLKDSFQVIRWYCNFIHVKIGRAFSSVARSDQFAEELGFPKDSDGSAKVALISAERSLQAWKTLYELLPDQQDRILGILAMLQQVEKLIRERFPRAMDFVRPGFDDALHLQREGF